MEKTVIDQLADRIYTLLGDNLGVRGKTLDARFRKAGRLVPRRAREPIKFLIEAQKMAENPGLAMKLDDETISTAYDQAVRALGDVDRVKEKSRKRFNLAALLSLQVILIATAFIVFMQWRGFF